MYFDKGDISSIFKRVMLNRIKKLYHKLYMGLTKQCRKSQLYKKNKLIHVHDAMHSERKGIVFTIKGYSTNNKKNLPDLFIDDEYQRKLLSLFDDELNDTTWRYSYGMLELENACFAFPYIIHRIGNVLVKQGVGDSDHCLCQPRYLLSYLSTFRPKKQIFDSAILLPLPFFENYYHWTIETLPRLKMISEDPRFDGLPIVIPQRRCPRFVLDSIALAGFYDRVLILDNGAYKAKHLFIPTLYAPRSQLSLEAVQWLNDNIVKTEPAESNDANYERIFISREDADTRRVINTAEVDGLLNRYGIKKVLMSEYSVAEQARLFKNAKLVVGLHGAALSNVVFCNSETTLLEIFMEGWFTKAFYNLSRIKGMKYGCLLCQQQKGDIFVDTEKLEKLIGSVI